MMIHPPDECSQDPEDSFNFTRMGKLKFLVNITVMRNSPPIAHPFVYCSTIGIHHRLWVHIRLQEIPRMFPSGFRMGENLIRKLLRSYFLSHEQGPSFFTTKVCLIKLYQMIKCVIFKREMTAEAVKPMTNRWLRQTRHLYGLFDGNLDGPTPQDHPELLIRELHVSQPGVRQERKPHTTFPTSISSIRSVDMITLAYGTIHVLTEDYTAQILAYLRIRWDLVELVHIHISYMVCANIF